MKTIATVAQKRELGGTKAELKQMRRDGKVPAVLYGNGEAQHIAMEYADLKPILFTADTYIVQLAVDGGEAVETIVREAQYHPVTDRIIHVDFMAIPTDKKIEIVLPVKFEGAPVGVIKGGKLMPKMRRLKVKGEVATLPEFIEVPVGHLDLGMSIKVNEISVEGLEITSGGSAAIASVEIPRALRSSKSGEGDGGEAEGAGEEGETEE
ncbi:MAG: 50S ribosomal protein L25 [Bacteroidia bacterium]